MSMSQYNNINQSHSARTTNKDYGCKIILFCLLHWCEANGTVKLTPAQSAECEMTQDESRKTRENFPESKKCYAQYIMQADVPVAQPGSE